jgi:acetylornithine deacetylase/succinyl-diaminopimelate desuccinylase-like protein
MNPEQRHAATDSWLIRHFEEQVGFLQSLVRQPTDTPPGDNAPHAHLTRDLVAAFGLQSEMHEVPAPLVHEQGMRSVCNVVVRHRFGPDGPVIGLNAHGDVVPPGEGWTHPPYGAEIHDGRLYGRAAAVSKSDFSTYVFALRALQSLGAPMRGAVELYFTYDEEFGGELGPGWLLRQGIVHPDLVIAAGFGYQVVTAHNGCLQFEVTVNGQSAHAAIPDSGRDALQGAVTLLQALYALNVEYREIHSSVAGIDHPYLNVGLFEAGTNTNVVPGRAVFKLDRRLIPEEDIDEVEREIRTVIAQTAGRLPDLTVEVRRILRASPLKPLDAVHAPARCLADHARSVFEADVPIVGTPLYADARLFAEAGIPALLYGAGPRTVRESNAKRADEHIVLDDLLKATRVVARALGDLLSGDVPAG